MTILNIASKSILGYCLMSLFSGFYARKLKASIIIMLVWTLVISKAIYSDSRTTVRSLYIPLADHYAAIVAFEKYRGQMVHANFQIHQMKNWDLLRAYYLAGNAEMAFVMSPLAMDMYLTKPEFRWVGLMHRDGNALAVNRQISNRLNLEKERIHRKPNEQLAKVLREIYEETGRSVEIGMPHLLSTHSVVLYNYLKERGLDISFKVHEHKEVQALAIAPPRSPAFLKANDSRLQAAAFEQSLPWADVVETEGYGHIAWYSKDVLPWKHGHVECIALATDKIINSNPQAIKEVMDYIKLAGQDIERAREVGGDQLNEIVSIIRKHIPAHTEKAIKASLDPNLRVINYHNLNIDKEGIKLIMDLGVEGGVLKAPINIEEFAAPRFNTNK